MKASLKNASYICFFLIFSLIQQSCVTKKDTIAFIDQYNVIWDSQSENSLGSMPLGGGDIGCNVWVEDGDILFYMARGGTFDENNTMLKLGRTRVRLTPNPFEDKEATFKSKNYIVNS